MAAVKYISLAILLFALCGCGHTETKTTLNVQRVFMTHPGDYCILVKNERNGELRTIANGNYSCHIYADVPAGQHMWAVVDDIVEAGELTPQSRMDIHIHDPSEISGAEWNRGKSGSETTNPVE